MDGYEAFEYEPFEDPDVRPGSQEPAGEKELCIALVWINVVLAVIAILTIDVQPNRLISMLVAIAVPGFAIAYLALRRGSIRLLYYGLFSPNVTTVAAFINHQYLTAVTLLMMNCAVVLAWATWETAALIDNQAVRPNSNKSIRFRLIDLFVATTLVAIGLTLFLNLYDRQYSLWLLIHAGSVLGISCVLVLAYMRRFR